MKTHTHLLYDEVTRTELQALHRMNWDLYRVIPLDFTELLIKYGLISDDDVIILDNLEKIKDFKDKSTRRPRK